VITRSTLIATALATMAVSAIAEGDASADIRVRIGGGSHIRVGGGWHVRTPRVHWRPRWHYARPAYRVHIGGAIWLGGGYYTRPYAAPPPPPAYCDCGPSTVPSYYPVSPGPATYAAAAPAPRLPTFGIGLFAGGVDVEGDHVGEDYGVIGRLRLSRGLLVEGEVGKNELEDGARVDRRLGGGLVWEMSPFNRWSPYLLGSLGVTQVDVGDGDFSTTQSFGELGIGLRWAISPSLHLAADVRAGSRQNVDEEGTRPSVGIGRAVAPPAGDEGEQYTRARLSAILYF
jgi:hypothetical protein